MLRNTVIGRQVPKAFQVRFISNLLRKDPNAITLEALKKSTLTEEIEDDPSERLELIKKINTSDNSEKKALLEQLIPNFSLYFRLKPASETVINTNEIVARFLEINPGRVHRTWDLFKIHEAQINSVGYEVVSQVLEKLLNGEAYEIRGLEENEKFVIEESSLNKIQYLLQTYVKGPEYEAALTSVLNRIIEDNHIGFLSWVLAQDLVPTDFLAKYLKEQTPGHLGYLTLVHKLFETSPELLGKEQLVEVLNVAFNSNALEIEAAEQSESQFPHIPLDTKAFGNSILEYIETNKLDVDKSPESLLLRLKLIELYGINQSDIDKTLKKFHEYQTHEKYGIELVQNNVVKCFAYQAMSQDKDIFLKIAQTVMPADNEISIKVLQLLIVANSNFDIDTSLKIYNDYIQHVPKTVNERTKRSPSGMLTEALILGNLYDNDRNFSTLIMEKAVENGILTDEYEIAQVKKLFKVYGASFIEDDDWAKAKPIFKAYALDYIKNL